MDMILNLCCNHLTNFGLLMFHLAIHTMPTIYTLKTKGKFIFYIIFCIHLHKL